jgi:hypothetical protein
MKTGHITEAKEKQQCVYNILCECGRRYSYETSRHLGVRIKEHKYNLNQSSLKELKLAKHAYEEDHKIC